MEIIIIIIIIMLYLQKVTQLVTNYSSLRPSTTNYTLHSFKRYA